MSYDVSTLLLRFFPCVIFFVWLNVFFGRFFDAETPRIEPQGPPPSTQTLDVTMFIIAVCQSAFTSVYNILFCNKYVFIPNDLYNA